MLAIGQIAITGIILASSSGAPRLSACGRNRPRRARSTAGPTRDAVARSPLQRLRHAPGDDRPARARPPLPGAHPGMTRAERGQVGVRASVIGFAVLALFAVAGSAILSVFGITLPAFRVAGGLLLFYIAFEMVFERRQDRKEKSADVAITRDHIHNIAASRWRSRSSRPRRDLGDGADLGLLPDTRRPAGASRHHPRRDPRHLAGLRAGRTRPTASSAIQAARS